MNPVERVLHDELTSLIERLAATLPEGTLGEVRATNPALKSRLDEMDATLATLRHALLDGYARWGRALEDVENLWALAAWRSATAEETTEKAALAA